MDELEPQYSPYLARGARDGAGLAAALGRAGLSLEAQALTLAASRAAPPSFTAADGPWAGRRCLVSRGLPADARPGDLWVDLVELTPMLLVADPAAAPAKARWVATRPAQVWQYRGFLGLAQWRVRQPDFLRVDDLFADRLRAHAPTAPATDLYHEEAVAYAHWFGKYLCRQFDLQAARDHLGPAALAHILPAGLRLWDEVECAHSEFVRIAVGQATLDDDPDEAFERGGQGDGGGPGQIIFGEWERRPEIGLATMALAQGGLMRELPRRAYEFVELQNAAAR